MDDELEGLAVRVRADSEAFGRDVAAMGRELRDGLGSEAQTAARGIEQALRQAARSGRLEFEDLGRAAARALGDIAAAALKLDGGGLLGAVGTGLLGLPGRATGGPVAPGRAYVVGERGPELFVPTASGRVEAGGAGTARAVRVNVAMAAPRGGGTRYMAQTGRQLGRELRRVLERTNG